MWRKIMELEQNITNQRVELAREYMASQGVDTNELSANDLLSIYSCMVIKAKRRMENRYEQK